MLPLRTNKLKNVFIVLFMIFGLIAFTACSSESESNSNTDEEHTMEEGSTDEHSNEEMDSEHEHQDERISNPNGAAITILSPADDSSFALGDEVIVEIQVDNFALGENDNHWHVYVDGTSWGMVMGGNTSQSLNGLESGEHLVEVYLAGGDHIEFQDGDSIHISVE